MINNRRRRRWRRRGDLGVMARGLYRLNPNHRPKVDCSIGIWLCLIISHASHPPPSPSSSSTCHAIQHNVRRLREITNTRVMAVVKANAYGHGAVEVAAPRGCGRRVVRRGVCGEGVALRQAGLASTFWCWATRRSWPPMPSNRSRSAVYDLDVAKAYAESARSQHRRARARQSG